jgi:putative signal transducing protein
MPASRRAVDERANRPSGASIGRVRDRIARMGDELVRVFSTPSAIEGQLAKGRLEAEGIPVLLKGEGEGPYRMGPAQLFVPSSFEAHARLILESLEQADGVDDDAWQDANTEPSED